MPSTPRLPPESAKPAVSLGQPVRGGKLRLRGSVRHDAPQESGYPLRRRRRIQPQLAFPNYRRLPPRLAQQDEVTRIPDNVPGQFAFPEWAPSGGQDSIAAPGMAVPEATMNEHHYVTRRKGEIGGSGQVVPVQAIAVAHSVQQAPKNHLRSGVPGSDCGHVPPARRRHVGEQKALYFWGAFWHKGAMGKIEISDRRWVVLAEDGRFATLGRGSDPTPEEIARADESLQAVGAAGWLAIMDGTVYARRLPRLMMVRPLATPARSFDDAVGAFRRLYASAA